MRRVRRRDCDLKLKKMFSKEEDENLKYLVEVHGVTAWKVIAQGVMGRSARQCRERWKNYLAPNVVNMPWTPEQDVRLKELAIQYGRKWAKIASFFENRTDVNVKNRWVLLRRTEMRESHPVEEFEPPVSCLEPVERSPDVKVMEDAVEEAPSESLIEFWGSEVWEKVQKCALSHKTYFS